MMGRLSSKQGRSHRVGVSMETDKFDEAKEEPRLSGAYIRSLVKHLTAKDPLDGDDGMTKNLSGNEEHQQPPTQPPQHKKQVRRRLHTSRPYQERLLNMAEARREIVTALKFHRASMKQQETANNHDLQSSQTHLRSDQFPLQQERKSKSRRILGLYPSTIATATTTTTATSSCSSLSCPSPDPGYWPISTPPPPPPLSYYDNLNLVLPSQTLGLNLNFQNFDNLDTHLYHKPLSMYSASSTPSTSSSAPVSVGGEEVVVGKAKETVGGSLHHAMGDEEMEEIRSLGEQHQREWNDTLNLVTSARWSNFLKTMEIEAEERDGFDQAIEFPPWLMNANETSCLQQHFDEHFSDAYLQDPVLPCMDIGEIEGMDGEWLA